MMIVKKLASEGHLDAMYALQASKLTADLNDPDFSYTDEDKYQDGEVYYELARQGQMNAKWRIIDWYADHAYDELETKPYYEALREFSGNQSDEFLKEMINDYYYELVMTKARDKSLLRAISLLLPATKVINPKIIILTGEKASFTLICVILKP